MKHWRVKYSISWLALILMVSSVTIGLVASFFILQPGLLNIVLLCFAWILVVASAIWLFIQASNGLIANERKEEMPESSKPERKRDNKKPVSETENLDIDSVARKIVRRTSTDGNPADWGNDLLSMLSAELEIMSGIFYHRNSKNEFESLASYAFSHGHQPYTFKEGEGLNGQAVVNKQIIVYTTIPEEYSEVFSGLGSVTPSYLAMVPVIIKNKCIAILECAGFKYASADVEQALQIVARELAIKIESSEQQAKE